MGSQQTKENSDSKETVEFGDEVNNGPVVLLLLSTGLVTSIHK